MDVLSTAARNAQFMLKSRRVGTFVEACLGALSIVAIFLGLCGSKARGVEEAGASTEIIRVR